MQQKTSHEKRVDDAFCPPPDDLKNPSRRKLRITAMSTVINEVFADFCCNYNLKDENFKLEFSIVADLCERYFRDVIRLHDFHGTKRIDRHKIAGYVTYWICKLRPISFFQGVDDENIKYIDEFERYINEYFAICVAFGRIKSYFKDKAISAKTTLDDEFRKTFLYDLRYRLTTGANLSLVYYLVEKNFILASENKTKTV